MPAAADSLSALAASSAFCTSESSKVVSSWPSFNVVAFVKKHAGNPAGVFAATVGPALGREHSRLRSTLVTWSEPPAARAVVTSTCGLRPRKRQPLAAQQKRRAPITRNIRQHLRLRLLCVRNRVFREDKSAAGMPGWFSS